VSTSVGAVPLHEDIVEMNNCRDANKFDGNVKRNRHQRNREPDYNGLMSTYLGSSYREVAEVSHFLGRD